MQYSELEAFYLGLVGRAREAGVPCAITGGMACVHYGVVEITNGCELLCDPAGAGRFFELVAETELKGARAGYRGNLSPPLHRRWMEGGWTSHFFWQNEEGDDAYLDVFGVPPRASSRWQDEIEGVYVSRHTVAEMKRTDRDKDWPFATALGVRLLEAGDERGWLHIFDSRKLLALANEVPCAAEIVEQRPILGILPSASVDEVELGVRAEKEFWHQLDALRLSVTRKAIRRYMVAVRRDGKGKGDSLRVQHEVRVEKATECLVVDPLGDYGWDGLVEKARQKAATFLPDSSLRWLPDVQAYVSYFVR